MNEFVGFTLVWCCLWVLLCLLLKLIWVLTLIISLFWLLINCSLRWFWVLGFSLGCGLCILVCNFNFSLCCWFCWGNLWFAYCCWFTVACWFSWFAFKYYLCFVCFNVTDCLVLVWFGFYWFSCFDVYLIWLVMLIVKLFCVLSWAWCLLGFDFFDWLVSWSIDICLCGLVILLCFAFGVLIYLFSLF